MAGLEHQTGASNEVSYEEWSAQDRLRQELRQLEEQQKAQSTTQEETRSAQQEWEQRMRQVQTQANRNTTRRATARRTDSSRRLRPRLPYSFDALMVCGVTLLMASILGPVLHIPLDGSAIHRSTVRPPLAGVPVTLANTDWTLYNIRDHKFPAINWDGTQIHIETAPPKGQSGMVSGYINFFANGTNSGRAEFHGEFDAKSRTFDVVEDSVAQYSDFDKYRFIRGHNIGTIGSDGKTITGFTWGSRADLTEVQAEGGEGLLQGGDTTANE